LPKPDQASAHVVEELDPFDLPDWLGVGPVLWVADAGVRASHLVPGRLTGLVSSPVSGGDAGMTTAVELEQPCDLLAVDEAYPVPVADDATRLRAHQAWRHGQVLLIGYDRRLTLAVPGSRFTADVVLDTLDRLAKAVGASADNYAARLGVGSSRRSQAPPPRSTSGIDT
jgi:hypothetical protein